MKITKKTILKSAVIAVILVILLLFFRDSFAEGLREIRKVPPEKVLLLFVLSMGYFAAEGGIIALLAGSYTDTMRWGSGFACALYCSFFRLVTFGSGSGIAEVYYLSRKGMKAAEATGMSLVQYLIQKIAICLMGAVSFFCCFRYVERYIGAYQGYIGAAVLATMAIGGGIVLLTVFRRGNERLFLFLHRLTADKTRWSRQVERCKEQADILQDGAGRLYRRKGALVLALVLNLFKYFCWFLTPYVLYGHEEGITIGVCLVLMALATMLAGVIPTPSGYGSLDAMILLLFHPLLEKAKLVSLVILYRVVVSLFPFLVGAAVASRPIRTDSREGAQGS